MDQQGDHIALEIRAKIAQAPNPPTYTICRFPEVLVDIDDRIRKPQLTSFGPCHSRNPRLHPFNDHKRELMENFLLRKAGLEEVLRNYLDQEKVKIKIRSCYSENIFYGLDLNDSDLVDMMLLDGSFMLELFLEYDNYRSGRDPHDWDRRVRQWSVQDLIADLLNLENQLPFFILQRLFHLFNPEAQIDTLPNLALRFLNQAFRGRRANYQVQEPMHLLDLFRRNLLPPNSNHDSWMDSIPGVKYLRSAGVHLLDIFRRSLLPSINPDPQQNNHDSWMDSIPGVKYLRSAGVHLLDLFRRSLLPSINPDPQQSNHDSWKDSIPRVKDLRSAGITVRQKTARSLLEIDFTKLHIPPFALKIPSFAIDDLTKAILVNCVAMEKCFENLSNHFTAYVCFMSCLIEKPEDVGCLRSVDIISGDWQDDERFVSMLGVIGRIPGFNQRECYLWKPFREIQFYYNSCWASIGPLLSFNNIMLCLTLLEIAVAILSWRFPVK